MPIADIAIVGQGLAGTLLHHFLQKEGKKTVLFDANHAGAASKVAAGIMNPVTGRHYVKSWRIEDLLPQAEQTYRELENQLDIRFFYPRSILRALLNQRDENNWHLRLADPAYQPYLVPDAQIDNYAQAIHPAFAYGEIKGSAQVNIKQLIEAYQSKVLENNELIHTNFDYAALKINADKLQYHDWSFQNLIFAEGYAAVHNPFFNYLPFHGSKGEVLLISIEHPPLEKLLRHRIFLVPLGDKTYWVGSAYQNQFADDQPTSAGQTFLLEQLQSFLKVDFEVLHHLAAIRPTVKHRKPFLGAHPQVSRLFIFNGLGTKGASLGPFFARQLVDHIIHGTTLDPEVDIQQYPF